MNVNGSYTGVLGEMVIRIDSLRQSDANFSQNFQVNGRADIALADLYYTSYNLEHMDLSVPYNVECLTFLTPEALTDNSWQTLILPFR